MMDLKYVIRLKIKSNAAEAGPPLGTVLGNLGVNTTKFCKEFNDFTQDLPYYFSLFVEIFIYENRSFKFEVSLPSTGYLVSLLQFDRILTVRKGFFLEKKVFPCIFLKDVAQLALLKLPYLPLAKSFPIVWGTVKSAGLLVLRD